MSDQSGQSGQSGHYRDMRVTVRREGERSWLLFSEVDGQVVSSQSMTCDEATAVERATVLAGWFDAELVVGCEAVIP